MKRIAREKFGYQTVNFLVPRIDKTNPLNPSQTFEFAAVLVSGQNVFLVESKFSVRVRYI